MPTKPDSLSAAHLADRMRQRDDLIVATVGGDPLAGSINDYHAVRLKPGDRVRYDRDSRLSSMIPDGVADNGEATVVSVGIYDGFYVRVTDDESRRFVLWSERDFIEKVDT